MRTEFLTVWLVAGFSCGVTGAEQAGPAPGPVSTAGWVGSNYTPAYASNQVQMWHDYMQDFTDDKEPVLSGNIGLRTAGVEACFDNVVVLPAPAGD